MRSKAAPDMKKLRKELRDARDAPLSVGDFAAYLMIALCFIFLTGSIMRIGDDTGITGLAVLNESNAANDTYTIPVEPVNETNSTLNSTVDSPNATIVDEINATLNETNSTLNSTVSQNATVVINETNSTIVDETNNTNQNNTEPINETIPANETAPINETAPVNETTPPQQNETSEPETNETGEESPEPGYGASEATVNTTIVLNSSLGTNLTSDNLTVYYTLNDTNAKGIINWYKDGSSIMVLNMPFETLTPEHTTVTDQVGYWQFENELYDDDFDGTELNSNLWSPAGDWIYQDKLRINSTQNRVYSKFNLSGDFDIQVDFELVNFASGTWKYTAMRAMNADNGSEGFFINRERNGFNVYSCKSLPWTQQGSSVTTTATSGKFRITRSGSTFNGYYWSGSSWLQPSGCSWSGFTNDTLIDFITTTGDSEDIRYDNFIVTYGEPAWDSTGNNNGTHNGTIQALGKVGHAAELDGEDDFISIPDSPTLDITDGITITVWAKPREGMMDWANVMKKGSAYFIAAHATGSDYKFWGGVWVNGSWRGVGSEEYTFDAWYHLALTYNSSTRIEKFYMDGKEVASTTLSGLDNYNIHTDDNDLLIGAYTSTAQLFNGSIDEVQIYSRSLSASEIRDIYEDGLNSTFDAKDYSDSNNMGHILEATFNSTAGYDGKGAYEFDGGGDYITIPNFNEINGGSEFTVCAWVNVNTLGTTLSVDDSGIFNKGCPSSESVLFWYNVIGTTGNHTYTFHVGDAGEPNDRIDGSDGAAVANQWQFVCGVMDGNYRGLYIDGRLNASRNDAVVTTIPNVENITTIGGWECTSNFDFNGTIDEVRIYNHSLSPEQIKALYENRTDLIVSNETSLGDVWQACITPNDGNEDGATNCSNNLTILAPDTAPTYTQNSTNASDSTKYNETAWFAVNWTDETELSTIIFSINNGSWYNVSSINVAGNTSYLYNTTYTIDIEKGNTFQWKFYANDSSNNWNETSAGSFTVANTAPTQGIPILNSTSITNSVIENLTVYNQSTNDADGDPVKNIINWYRNGTSIAVLNMPFEADGDQNATDYSGFGNNGTVINATFNSTGGYDGKGAYEFDGSNGKYISIDDSDMWTFAGDFAIEWMAKFYSTSGNWWERAYIGHDEGGGSVHKWILSHNGRTFLHLNGPTSGSQDIQGNAWTPSVGQWYHLVLTREGTNYSFYRDGNADGSQINSATIGNGATPLTIGWAEGTTTFNGTIDEVRIYNHSLSPEQIKALYENRTDLIVSQETSVNETWQACITPNDGYEDGATNCSNNLTILEVPNAPVINSINATPSQQGYGENVTITANITEQDNDIDTVLVGIAVPGQAETNYSMANVSEIYYYQYLDYANGTYNVTVYVNDTIGLSAKNSTAFELFVNNTVQIKTLKDYYGENEWVKLTDPPNFYMEVLK